MNDKDSMMYIYKTAKNGEIKEVSIADLQAKTKYAILQEYKEKRKSKKLTQTDISTITSIPQPNITRFESGKSNPTLELLVKMAAAMDMEIEITLKDRKRK